MLHFFVVKSVVVAHFYVVKSVVVTHFFAVKNVKWCYKRVRGGVYMYRYAIEELFRWKEKPNRKPIIIQGARHVGKTWLMKEFGKKAYTHTVYINFEDNVTMEDLFSYDLDTKRLITGMELYSGKKIDPDNTLLIFDELQEVPRALTSLKYFNENALEYHIVCACSFMGIALHQGTSFPVGKVDFIDLYPLNFKEFLMATGKGTICRTT